MDDATRELIIKKLYHVFNIGEDEDEDHVTEEEFVKRVFRGWTSSVHIADDDTITREVFGVDWENIVILVDFCKENGLKFDVNESKNRGMCWIEIQKA